MQQGATPRPGLVTPDPALTARVRAFLASSASIMSASRSLSVSREVLARLASGLPVRRGSLLLVQRELEALAPAEGDR